MAEYIFTNLPQYIRITPRTDFSNSVIQENHVLLFSEDGETLTGKLSDGSFIAIGGGGTDVSDTTATAATVLSGYYFYNSSGVKTSGSIQTITASASGNVVTVPAGYIASSQTLTIGTAVAAQTITPGTTDQTIAADSYLSGAITVKGDANLVAANIANGVTIFGVSGTHQGATDFYKCASVDTVNETWTGYKAVLTDGVYSFESTVTSGLTYESWLTPEVGKVYDSNALVKASLYQGIWVGDIFDAPLTSNQTSSGDTITVFSEQVTFNSLSDGIAGAYLHDGGSLKYPLSNVPEQLTLSGWVKYTGSTTGWFIVIGQDSYNGAIGFGCPQYPGYTNIGYGGGANSEFFSVDVTVWHHYALVRNGSTFLLYVDGVLAISHTNSGVNVTNKTLYIGCANNGGSYPIYLQPGYYSNVRIHSWALSAAEIAQLAAEFTPSAS